MIRKLLIPVAAAALLAGCVTPGYQYRSAGSGGYYYGQPTVRSVPYGYGSVGYGTRGGFYGSVGYGSVHGYPYGGYGYYPGFYYPGYYRTLSPRYVGYPYGVYPRPGVGQPRPDRGQQRRAPWRDMEGWSGPRGPRGQQVTSPQPQRIGSPAGTQQVQQPQRSGGALRAVYSERAAPVQPRRRDPSMMRERTIEP